MPQPPKFGLHTQIRGLIFSSFNLEEFRTLCHDLGVSYDDLSGEGLSARIRELISRLDREQRLDDLLNFCTHLRPKLAWPDLGGILIHGDPVTSITIQPSTAKSIHTLVVDQLMRGDYDTISEAIKNARPGDRILIREGIYTETLVIDKPLEIIGGGQLGDVEVHASYDNVIRFMTTAGVIRNLILRQTGGGRFFAVWISQGHLRLEDCDISSQSLACVEVDGRGTTPTLRGNKIHNGKHGGIIVRDDAQGLFETNEIWGNEQAGIEICAATPIVRNNKIYDGKKAGIYIHDNTQALIEANEIWGNNYAGIEIKTGSTPIVRNNKIHDGKASGIYVHDNAQGVIEANDIWSNYLAGILIETHATPIVRDNQIRGSHEHSGIYVDYEGHGLLETNKIWGNRCNGIEVRDGSTPIVRGNIISHNGYHAISIYEKGGGIFERNDLRNNAKGSWLIEADSQVLVTKKGNIED